MGIQSPQHSGNNSFPLHTPPSVCLFNVLPQSIYAYSITYSFLKEMNYPSWIPKHVSPELAKPLKALFISFSKIAKSYVWPQQLFLPATL